MKRLLMILLTLSLMTMMLTGCKKKEPAQSVVSGDEVTEEENYDDYEEDTEDEEFTSEYAAYKDGGEWGNNFEGSAVYLEGTTAVVTVAVATEKTPWEEKSLTAAKKKASTALDFISKAGKDRKKDVNFVFDKADLNYEYTYSGNIEDFEYEDYDSVVTELLDGTIDAKKIREDNKADGIAYLFLLNGRGTCFASPHYQEDETEFFSEAAYMFATGYDDEGEEVEVGPADYAHQLLRLFGAVELMEPDATFGYTLNLFDAVEKDYKNDIMYTTLDAKGKVSDSKITNEITDITAYSVGWVDDFKELKENEAFKKDFVGCFVDNYMKNTKDGEDVSDYESDGYEEGIDSLDTDMDSISDDDFTDAEGDEEWTEEDENWEDESWDEEGEEGDWEDDGWEDDDWDDSDE